MSSTLVDHSNKARLDIQTEETNTLEGAGNLEPKRTLLTFTSSSPSPNSTHSFIIIIIMNPASLTSRFTLRSTSIRSVGALRSTIGQQSQRRFAASESMGQDLIKERNHHKDHAGKSADLWRKVSIYGCVPFAIVMAIYIGRIESEHLHHRDHEIEENGGELPETTKYDYNDMRKKVCIFTCFKLLNTQAIHTNFVSSIFLFPFSLSQPFPWANEGKDNSFFFNAKANRSVDL